MRIMVVTGGYDTGSTNGIDVISLPTFPCGASETTEIEGGPPEISQELQVARVQPLDDHLNQIIDATMVPDKRDVRIAELEAEISALKQTTTVRLDPEDLYQRWRDFHEADRVIHSVRVGDAPSISIGGVSVVLDDDAREELNLVLQRRAEQRRMNALNVVVTTQPKDALFYLVWSPNGHSNPRQRHHNEGEARRIAKDMSNRHGGQFYTVAVLGDVSVVDPANAKNDDHIPF